MGKFRIPDYFLFSKKDRNGIILLITIIAVLIVVKRILSNREIEEKTDYTKFENDIIQFEQNLQFAQKKDETGKRRDVKKKYRKEEKNIMFRFNPNTISLDSLTMLGFTRKQANVLLNYRQSGARFHKPVDIKKVYGIGEREFQKLKAYIYIPVDSENCYSECYKGNSKTTKKIELNTADSMQLCKLHGIGPVLAGRILKYRNILGGYYSKEQLKEVYGLKDSVFDRMSKNIVVDTSLVEKIRIEGASKKEMSFHPYISSYDANAITHYRKFAKADFTIKDLLINKIIDSISYSRLQYYLK